MAAPVRAFISRDEDDLAARMAGLDDAVAFSASLSEADRLGQVSAAGSRLTQQEAVAAVRDRHGTGTAAP
jgi:hypothetical protein